VSLQGKTAIVWEKHFLWHGKMLKLRKLVVGGSQIAAETAEAGCCYELFCHDLVIPFQTDFFDWMN
jgi:hypothetical protein